MPDKQEADMQEDHDPNLSYIDGSDQDGASWNQDEIELHNKNFAECLNGGILNDKM
jgi:hypothetical protein